MTLTIGPLLGIKLATWRSTDQHLIHPKSSLQYRLHAVMGDLQIKWEDGKEEERKERIPFSRISFFHLLRVQLIRTSLICIKKRDTDEKTGEK